MNSENNAATLMSHSGTDIVTREQLAVIPPVIGTDTFKPVPHIELVQSIQAVLEARGITIIREQFALRSDSGKLFGTFDLSLPSLDGTLAAMGIRTGNDRTTKLQIVAGMKVVVCDNGLFAGDSIILNRKHTAGLDLLPELMGAVGKYTQRFDLLTAEVTEMQSLELTDTEAKGIIHDAFLAELMPIRYLPNVSNEYFHPRHPEFEPRTAWVLHNAFTEIAKDMSLNRRMEAVQGLGQLFGLVAGTEVSQTGIGLNS